MNRMYKICALVTLFYPDEKIIENILLIKRQVTSIIVIDNTPNNKDNFKLFKDHENIYYFSNMKNYGISKAFNMYLNHSLVTESEFILFFDQDSLIHEKLVENLVKDYNILMNNKISIGCIGPVYYEKNANKLMIPKIKKLLFSSVYEVDSIITSSMLTTYNTLKKINFWNEEIFLDLADWDLCWRLKASGFKCCLTQHVVLNHVLGKSVKKIGPFSIKEGASIREYYQTRDCLKLLLKKYTPFRYKIRFILMLTIRPIVHIFFLSEKYSRAKYIFLGFIDFFRAINGSFDFRNIKKK